MNPWWLLPMFAFGGIIGVVLMAAVALGKIKDLDAEIGDYQYRLRRLARECRCTRGDGA